MVYLWLLLPILQILLSIHAYRNGKSNWIYFIVFFPGFGLVIYFLIEYLPALKGDIANKSAVNSLLNKLLHNRIIRHLSDEVSLNNSVNNRLALAKAYLESNQPENAIPLFESCLEGIYKNDPYILMSLSQGYFDNNKYQKALETYIQLSKDHPEFKPKEIPTFIAKCYDEMGLLDQAINEYSTILKFSVGEEIKCRYGLALMKKGNYGDAAGVFNSIVRNIRISPSYYKRTERKWFYIAKKELKNCKNNKSK
jgi:hypothetical protein